jgi:hypothetical protein
MIAAVANIGMKDQTVNAKFKPFKEARNLIRHGGTRSEIPPGVGLRIGQHTMDGFIENMDGFFPHYFTADLGMPKNYHQ